VEIFAMDKKRDVVPKGAYAAAYAYISKHGMEPETVERTLERLQKMMADNKPETDRGHVLRCGALLDRLLETLFRLKFRACSKATDAESDFWLTKKPLPPLGSAWIKSKMASILGLVEKRTSKTLCDFFTIRNCFAHEMEPPALTNSLLCPLLKTLPESFRSQVTLQEDGSADGTIMLFVITHALASEIILATQEVLSTLRPANSK
jgi:hypothetical protein